MSWSILFVCGVLLVALTIYALTGGADYGSGVWDLLARGRRGKQQRELMAEAIGPIWEADHVWLILVVVILFTAFPAAFAAIMTSLNVPITLMLIGVVMRGAALSFRNYGNPDREAYGWGRVFAVASVLTPLLLGVTIGAIAAGRIAANPHRLSDFLTPWLTPFCLSVGLLSLLAFAYLAATYATLETDDPELRDDFRIRAIVSALAIDLMALLVLLLSINGAPAIWRGLTQRPWIWPLLWATGLMAVGALYSLCTRRYVIARLCAAGQVALLLWGWALAQFPNMVEPSLTISSAAAPPGTIHLLAGALALGALLLLPSYGYLMMIFKSHTYRRPTIPEP